MLKQLSYERIQKGLSLIEASMVLVLSAVVVAGVMVYYQTAQTNHQLEQTSTQIMHIVSEVNGLYAGSRDNGSGIYYGLETETLLNAVADLEPFSSGGSQMAIKTAIPNVLILTQGGNYDPVTKTSDDNGPANSFAILLLGEDSKAIAKLCQKFVALDFGGQALAYSVSNQSTGQEDIIDVSAPFSDRLKACQGLTGKNEDAVGVYFK